jgi:DTW domain-containing protein YfiP
LLILQHHLELRQAKGTGRLLHLCVPGSALLAGEQFDSAELAAALAADGRQPVLLYPADAEAPCCDPAALAPAQVRLVVLDGTWRKSRKLLHCNPGLRALPRVALADVPPSAYRIRKAHAPHQLSTIEAAALALGAVDPACDTAPLFAAFDALVAMQAAFLPGGRG